MNLTLNLSRLRSAVAALAILAMTTAAHGALVATDVTGWARHNGTAVSIVNAASKNPGLVGQNIIPAGDNYVLMAPFDPITLSNPNEYVKFSVSVKLNERQSSTAANNLNNNLRFGIFSFTGANPANIVVDDASNHGFVAQYINGLSGADHLQVREQRGANTNPFMNINTIGTVAGGQVTADVGGNSISGANPPKIDYEITVTRNGSGTLDISGFISNLASGGQYESTFSVTGYSSTAFPANGPFTFNRVGLYFNNANAGSTSSSVAIRMTDATITTNIPEPQTVALAVMAVIGGAAVRSRRR